MNLLYINSLHTQKQMKKKRKYQMIQLGKVKADTLNNNNLGSNNLDVL